MLTKEGKQIPNPPGRKLICKVDVLDNGQAIVQPPVYQPIVDPNLEF